MARYKVKAANSHLFLPGIGRVRPGQIIEGVGLERYADLLVEVPDAPGAPVEKPKVEARKPLEARPAETPLESTETPSEAPLVEKKAARRRRTR